MAEELRLWATNVDEFRQCFAAPPELAQTLREITDSFQPADTHPRSRNLLSMLGPLLRRPPTAPVVRPLVPNHMDAESMMTSRYIASDRLSACWILAQAWLDHLSAAHTIIPLPRTAIDELEFDLVRVGIPTELSIRHLWRRGVDIPLRPSDEISVGYTPYDTVLEISATWNQALPDLEESTVEFATPVVEFLASFSQYADPQYAAPRPDLIAVWTSR